MNNIYVITKVKEEGFNANNCVYSIDDISPTILARDYKDPKRILINNVEKSETVK